jgi:hypothetical protein
VEEVVAEGLATRVLGVVTRARALGLLDLGLHTLPLALTQEGDLQATQEGDLQATLPRAQHLLDLQPHQEVRTLDHTQMGIQLQDLAEPRQLHLVVEDLPV